MRQRPVFFDDFEDLLNAPPDQEIAASQANQKPPNLLVRKGKSPWLGNQAR
ncbi:hypothetical protein IVB38_24410 [Bradyrhizobium sp. 38]|uniref:hypothetical protein n=1 Tax=unclassified Bradyrhizobium TaxID=2631580 RepID=UPI001FFB2073|nr:MULTISPECIES: hypothetical protein [unclassified Bradyrhizobium]MCK1339080.1 hypothetical protein [Bradyrhizobium sp. 38]MCK1782701.1 hypothetical protein [Bradyrhizobium sp. 132]